MAVLKVEISQKRQQCPNCRQWELINTGRSSRFSEPHERWWCKHCGSSLYVSPSHFGGKEPAQKEAPTVSGKTYQMLTSNF